MTTYKCLLYDVVDGIVTITLNRPERLNALGDTLREDLHDAVMHASEDDQVRVMVVTGAGKGFCSGGDVKAMNERRTQGAPQAGSVSAAPAGRQQTRSTAPLAAARDRRLAPPTAEAARVYYGPRIHPHRRPTHDHVQVPAL